VLASTAARVERDRGVDGVTRLMEEVKKNFPSTWSTASPGHDQSVREGIKEI